MGNNNLYVVVCTQCATDKYYSDRHEIAGVFGQERTAKQVADKLRQEGWDYVSVKAVPFNKPVDLKIYKQEEI